MIRKLNRPNTEGMRILLIAAEIAARVDALAAAIRGELTRPDTTGGLGPT
jgi:hypothetical protein